MLDAVADSLEAKGLIKEAYEIDKIANKFEEQAKAQAKFMIGKGLDISYPGMLEGSLDTITTVEPGEVEAIKSLLKKHFPDGDAWIVPDGSIYSKRITKNTPTIVAFHTTNMMSFWSEARAKGLIKSAY